MNEEQTKQFIIMGEDIKILKQEISEIKQLLKDLPDNFEKKYAGKWVEKVLWGIGGIVGTSVVISIINLIIKK